MLYLTTRNKADSYTAHRVLRSETAPDGGQFLPMQTPVLTDVQLAAIEQMTFGEATAFTMNLFFGTQLTGWDVDFAIGRQVMDLPYIGHQVHVAESWHNPAGSHAYMAQRLYALVVGEKIPAQKPNLWFHTCVDIAVILGAYGRLCRGDVYTFDVAVETGDLQLLLALRYAQKMGVPIQKIILGSFDGDGLWEFFSYGDYPTARKLLPSGLESLLWLEFSHDMVKNYLQIADKRGIFKLSPVQQELFAKDIFVAVVGDGRAADVAASAQRTSQYAMEHTTARAFGALQDLRAKLGEKRNTMLFSRKITYNQNNSK